MTEKTPLNTPQDTNDIKAYKLEDYALWYLGNGFSVIPLREKRPLIDWKEYQKRLPTTKEIKKWFTELGPDGVGVICGEVSDLLVVDFDDPALYEGLVKKLRASGDDFTATLDAKVEGTLRARTARGLHLYFMVPNDCNKTGPIVKGVDIKGEGSYVVAPPSLHPSGVTYSFEPEIAPPEPTRMLILELSCEELDHIKKLLRGEDTQLQKVGEEKTEERELSLHQINTIVEQLKDVYQPGVRDYIVLYLSGWLRKAGISYNSAKKVVELLTEGDEERDQRLYVLDRTYERRGTPPTPEEMKGKSGLLEILEQIAGEEKALDIIRAIEEAFGAPSPYRDAVFALLDMDRRLYAVANLRKLMLVRATATEKTVRYREIVASCAPTEVTMYINPITQLTKYEVVVERPLANGKTHKIRLGPAYITEIIERITELEGVVRHRRLFADIFTAVIDRMIQTGRAQIKYEIESPGFYVGKDGNIIAVKYDTAPPTPEELKKALDLLDELAGVWYAKSADRFAAIIKWGLIAPLSYVLKVRGKMLKWLYLFGDSATGKTTLGKIVLSMWGLSTANETSGAGIDTVPRLGERLSRSTFPLLVNEPGGALGKDDVLEAIKNAADGLVVRGKFVKGSYVEYPALSASIFTSNKDIPKDDALRRRLYVITFSYGDKISEDRQVQFREKVIPRLNTLSVIGRFVAHEIINHPELLEKDPLAIAEEILVRAYTTANKTPPEWVKLTYKEEAEEPIAGAFIEALRKLVNDLYSRYVARQHVSEEISTDAGERLVVLLRNDLLPGARLKGEDVCIFKELLTELELDNVSLRSLAEMMRWELVNVKVGGTTVRKAVRVSLTELKEKLSGFTE